MVVGRAKLGGVPMGVIAVETSPVDGERGWGWGGVGVGVGWGWVR